MSITYKRGYILVGLLTISATIFSLDLFGFKKYEKLLLNVSVKCLRTGGTVLIYSGEDSYSMSRKDRGCNGYSNALDGKDVLVKMSGRNIVYEASTEGEKIFETSLHTFTVPFALLCVLIYLICARIWGRFARL